MKRKTAFSFQQGLLAMCLCLAVVGFTAAGALAAETDDALDQAAQAESLLQEAQASGDPDMLGAALALAEEASRKLQTLAQEAAGSGNSDLAQAVKAGMDRVEGILAQVIETANNLAATSTDSAVVGAAQGIAQSAGTAQGGLMTSSAELEDAFPGGTDQDGTDQAQETVTPVENRFETPATDDRPPIQDAVPASPV